MLEQMIIFLAGILMGFMLVALMMAFILIWEKLI